MRTHLPRSALCATFAFLCAGLLFNACGGSDTRPCNECPNVGGTWTLSFTDPSVPPDCTSAGLGLPDEPLEVKQVGSALTSELLDVPVRGTLYDSFDFNLNGAAPSDAGTTNLSVTGRYIPAQPAIDAGERLEGTFTGSRGGCILSRRYEARR